MSIPFSSKTWKKKPLPKAGSGSGCPGATVPGGGAWCLGKWWWTLASEQKNDERLDPLGTSRPHEGPLRFSITKLGDRPTTSGMSSNEH